MSGDGAAIDAGDTSSDSELERPQARKRLFKKRRVQPRQEGAEGEEESDLGQVATRARRDWILIESYNESEQEESFVRESILKHSHELMRASGLTFLACQKKKDTNLGMWVRKSTKTYKDNTTVSLQALSILS